MHDVIIMGAGVIGCAVAQKLSRYQLSVAVIDRAHDVADGASKANSGIVHAGFDAKPGSRKAYFNVKGAKMYPALAKELGVPYKNIGALVVGFEAEDRETLEKLVRQGEANGVDGCRMVEQAELRQMEPNINPQAMFALYAPTSAVVSPYEMTLALAYHAADNGAQFMLDTEVKNVSCDNGIWHVCTDQGEYTARAIVNCLGVGADDIHNQISDHKMNIIARRGEYYLLDHSAVLPFTRTMFQVPTKMGKGVLVSPTAHGNLLLGPSADDIEDDFDTATTRKGLDFVLEKCKLTWPTAATRTVITTFSGIRAHDKGDDFIIGTVPGAAAGAFEAAGIESPGLSAAPAIGEELGDQVAAFLDAAQKPSITPPVKLLPPFSGMSTPERAAAYQQDPHYGRIVCRCEEVTEAEIRDAIRRPLPARSLDAVKRRTRAGMGRCQGGFCSPRVLEILCEELHIPPTAVTKCGGNSMLLVGTIAEIAKEGQADV